MNTQKLSQIVGFGFWVEPSGSSTLAVGVVMNTEPGTVEVELKRAQKAVREAGFHSRMSGRGVFKNLRVWS